MKYNWNCECVSAAPMPCVIPVIYSNEMLKSSNAQLGICTFDEVGILLTDRKVIMHLANSLMADWVNFDQAVSNGIANANGNRSMLFCL